MVKMVLEESQTPPTLLILTAKKTSLIKRIADFAQAHDTEVHTSMETPPRTEQYNYIIVYGIFDEIPYLLQKNKKPIIAITTNKKQYDKLQTSHRLKKIYIASEHVSDTQFDQLVWYIFTPQRNPSLEILITSSPSQENKKTVAFSYPTFSVTQIVLYLVGISSIYIIITALLLWTSIVGTSQLILTKSCALATSQSCKLVTNTTSQLSKIMYQGVRPVLFLFSAGLQSDAVYSYKDQLDQMVNQEHAITEYSQDFVRSVIRSSRRPQQRLAELIQSNRDQVGLINTIKQFTPSFVPYANEMHRYIEEKGLEVEKIGTVLTTLPQLANTQLLLLIVNNKQALPGGGRISHIGTLSLKDFGLQQLHVIPIAQVLEQRVQNQKTLPDPSILFQSLYKTKSWDDRELMFSPDLSDNYNSIRSILGSDIDMSNTQGTLLVSYSALQNILEDTGPLYLSSFNETVTNSNLINQLKVHNNDPDFMDSVLSEIVRSYADERSASARLGNVLVDSFTDKYMALYATQPDVQKAFGKIYWSGNFVPKECRMQDASCITDYIYTTETEIQSHAESSGSQRRKKLEYHTQLRADGSALVQLHLLFNLNTQSPMSDQQWYEQILLPSTTSVKRVTINGVETNDFSFFTSSYNVLGLSLTSQNQKILDVGVEYEIEPPARAKNAVYQLVVQKQIGQQGYDMEFEMRLPENISPAQFNFSPVVNQNRVFYNTQVNTDRIFLISLNPPKQ